MKEHNLTINIYSSTSIDVVETDKYVLNITFNLGKKRLFNVMQRIFKCIIIDLSKLALESFSKGRMDNNINSSTNDDVMGILKSIY